MKTETLIDLAEVLMEKCHNEIISSKEMLSTFYKAHAKYIDSKNKISPEKFRKSRDFFLSGKHLKNNK